MRHIQMEAIHERLLQHTFPDHSSALDYCTRIAAGFGYNVKHDQFGNKVSVLNMSQWDLGNH